MAWRVELDRTAEKQIEKLDEQTRRVVLRFFRERIADRDDPRLTGKALSGELSGLWRYRIGDYRAICEILDDQVVVFVLELVHRREAYR